MMRIINLKKISTTFVAYNYKFGCVRDKIDGDIVISCYNYGVKLYKFESKNIYYRIFIFCSFFLLLRLSIWISLSVQFSELSSLKLFSDPFLISHSINTILFLAGFIFSLIKVRNWKQEYYFITDQGIKYYFKKKETLIPFDEINEINFNSSKIITSKNIFRFPFGQVKELSFFLYLVKMKIQSELSTKTTKRINIIITNSISQKQWKQALVPQILFILLQITVIYFLFTFDKIYNFPFLALFIPIFSSMLFLGVAEIVRYYEIKKNIDFNTLSYTNPSSRRIWTVYVSFMFLWLLLSLCIFWIYK